MIWHVFVGVFAFYSWWDNAWLVRPIEEAVSQQNSAANNFINSWNAEPISDIVVLDIDASPPRQQ